MKRSSLALLTLILVTRIGFSCSCFPPSSDFYENVSNYSTNGIIRLDSTYILSDSINEYHLPMAIFTLIKGFNFLDKNDGDTLLLFGQDGVNCAVGFDEFNHGDTLVVALSKEQTYFSQEEIYSIPFFGSGCGVHYLRITNGMSGGLSLIEIEQKVRGIMTDVAEPNFPDEIHVFPNPFADRITITAISGLNFQLFNPLGQVVYSANCSSEGKTMIDASHLPKGLYIATLLTGDKRKMSVKLVKE